MNSITLQGSILTYDILDRIASDEEVRQTPMDYGCSNKSEILSQLESTWGIIKLQYGIYLKRLEDLKEGESGVSQTRRWWMAPFLSELGYEIELNKSGQIINDRNYFISHQDSKLGGFPLHIIGANQSLDKKETGMRMSSHALIQEYLNHQENLYALVTNGRYLRLLRDSELLTKISYVEFDLHKMIKEDQFSDFVILWKLLHVTRMPEDPEKGPESILEQYHLSSLESGSRIREKLSLAVKHGISILANGLIQEPQNEDLREWLSKSKSERPKEYYGELLRLIYRILFVMVIEERDLIYPSALSEEHRKQKDIYYKYYSLQRLRQLALKHYFGNDQHYDLWQYMINVFHLYEGPRGQKLGIQALAGDLFSPSAIAHIGQCALNNDILLQVFRGLTVFENDQGQTITVNYKSLDVEEFGSVYEGLLELDPAIDLAAKRFSFIKGEERSISGSHYTPDELVQPLIKHSLEHLINDILSLDIDNNSKIQKLLKLSVCDVACGSGHILLSAARRIGLEIARLRSGEEQPNVADTRIGVRDAIKNCIYGVDKNPLAVELCKVAMWLEAHVPGEPLNFLDHKIKNGDAIVGMGRMEELYNGIATEAFKSYSEEEKENCRILRSSNKKQRKDREDGQLQLRNVHEIVEDKIKGYKEKFETFAVMPEHTIEEIEQKKIAYGQLTKGSKYWFVKTLSDLQVAQFFVDKSDLANAVTDNDYFDIMTGRKTQTRAEVMSLAESTKRSFFHWFLEFPEVFAEGGFSTVLGNPPFLGGQKISGTYGNDYAEYLKKNYEPIGSVDLVTYFFRRIYDLIQLDGFQSLIATNTIAQGDARAGGLEVILERGGSINHAVRSMRWPGIAAVEVALLTIYKAEWDKQYVLDGKNVDHITAYLDDQEFLGNPYMLEQNDNKSFQGSILLGTGFILEPEEAERLIDKDPKNKDVIFPYLSGHDLNNEVDQHPTRWVINFFDWPEEKAKEYADCYNILLEKVKPERLKQKDKDGKRYWWRHLRMRPELYETIEPLDRVLLIPTGGTKYIVFSFASEQIVYAHTVAIFAIESFKTFTFLNNSLNDHWAWKYCTTKGGSTLRYSPNQGFKNFSFSQIYSALLNEKLDVVGEHYHEFRRLLMLDIQLGLTKTYNQFHNSELVNDARKDISELSKAEIKNEFSKESWNLYNHLERIDDTISFTDAVEKILELRRLHVEMDHIVLEAYGWHIDTRRWGTAIALEHDFYEVDYLPENDRIRFTIHPDARKEVLKRLLLLNHEVHESEERGISYQELDREKKLKLMNKQISKWCLHVNHLEEQTLIDLSTAEDLLPGLDGGISGSYKPFVTSYCSALENELAQKLFIPFNNYFQSQNDTFQDKKDFLTDQVSLVNQLNLFARKLERSDTDYELGTMRVILSFIWKEDGRKLKNSALLQDLRQFILTSYESEILDLEFLDDIKDLVDNLRNPAAHTGSIDKSQANQCKKEVRRLMNLLVEHEIES